MLRKTITPRGNYQEIISKLGFGFSQDYWLENAYYSFTKAEIAELEIATGECYNMYIAAVEHIINNNLWDKLHIPAHLVSTIIDSWNSDELSLYGRFDFAMINGVPKLLEFNADTPTSLYEAAVIQWQWKEDQFPKLDQFNSIHEMLIASWKTIHEAYQSDKYHFACIDDNLEDYTTTAYLMSTAIDAGLNAGMLDIATIQRIDDNFFDESDVHLDILFKLYPYEWMFNEEFNTAIPYCQTTFIEPLWKSIMSNKYLLVVLSELFPKSPYILKCADQPLLNDYCKKPIFSREGANVTLVKDKVILEETAGEYGEEGFVFQELVDIPSFDGKFPVIGSWAIGGEPCGIGIRETESRITNNMANFMAHVIE